jgi:hypothetical protein
LTDPPEDRTLEMIEDAKSERDSVHSIASTRMVRAMWLGETETELERKSADRYVHCFRIFTPCPDD